MRHILERLLRSVDPPDPERAERLWADYRANRAGADVAFATLMAWYGGPIYRRIWGFVRSDAAEDVFQDVLVRLHRRRHRFADFEHALRWLRGVAVTQSLNAHRGARRRTVREQAHAAAGGTDTRPLETAELGEALRAALAKLPDREREAVALVYFEGLARQDAAAALGVHRDTITKLLDQALRRLRSSLAAGTVGTAVTLATAEAALAVLPRLTPARMSKLAQTVWADARVSTVGWLTARRLIPLLLLGGLATVAAAYAFTRSRPMPRTTSTARTRLAAERLEDRTVPSTDLVSAFGVGNATGGSSAWDVTVDATGNRYVTGSFMGTVDFDPGRAHANDADVLTAVGTGDAFVAKYAPDNSLVWARRMGGDVVRAGASPAAVDAGRSLALDSAGNVYVAGGFQGTAEFGLVSLTSAGGDDVFVTKLDANGTVLWASRWGDDGNDTAGGVGVDATGNVYAVSYRWGLDGVNDNGLDVVKFSPTGATVWTKWFNTQTGSPGCDIAVDAAGNVFLASQFRGLMDFDPGPKSKLISSGPSYSGFALKLTSAGALDWVAPFVGQSGSPTTGSSMAESITLDGSGNVIVGGNYNGLVDFNPGNGTTTLPTGGGGFIAKLTSRGGLTWAKAVEKASATGYTSVMVNALQTDAAGNVYATGIFGSTNGGGTVDFDPGAGVATRTTAGGNDIFVLKLTSAGNFGWAETFGSTGNDTARGLALDADGAIHLSGSFVGTVDFDPDPNVAFDLTTPGTFSNFFLVKLRPN